MAPLIDVYESDKAYKVLVELPSLKKEDIHVSLQDDVLTIMTDSKNDFLKTNDGQVIRQERTYGN